MAASLLVTMCVMCEGPARVARRGLVFGLSRGAQSVAVTSVTAARAEAWSTMSLPAAEAATRAAVPMLLTARG